MKIKKATLISAIYCLGLISCGGGGGVPGGDAFGTVFLTTSIAKPTIDVDLVNLSADANNCNITIPASNTENQSITFSTSKKPNIPQNTEASPVYIYQTYIKLTPAISNTEPFNRCIKDNISHPSISSVVPADGSLTLEIPVINQQIKECLVNNYGTVNQSCTGMNFDFGNQKTIYSVYAVLSFKAREINTGIEKTFEINLGTFNLSDFATGGQQ